MTSENRLQRERKDQQFYSVVPELTLPIEKLKSSQTSVRCLQELNLLCC